MNDLDIMNDILEDIHLESRLINVLHKPADPLFLEYTEAWGKERCIDNGYRPRTKHEVFKWDGRSQEEKD